MVGGKHVFWQALVFTIFVFLIGLMLGTFLEVNRSDRIQSQLMESEINLLDAQLREQTTKHFSFDCSSQIESSFSFADKIYDEAVRLERYDSASKFLDGLKTVHKRYDLLRLILWIEAVELKEKCPDQFHTVVYLYKYDVDDVDINSRQAFFSRLLLDTKNANPDKILLIPIAANLDLDSIDLVLMNYGLTQDALPAIIVDEEEVISDIISLEELRNVIFDSNKE